LSYQAKLLLFLDYYKKFFMFCKGGWEKMIEKVCARTKNVRFRTNSCKNARSKKLRSMRESTSRSDSSM